MTETQQQPAPGTSRESSPAGAPSSVRTVDDVAQVMVDQWGHRGEYFKNQILHRGDLDAAHYDWDSAVRFGTLRLLTQAEARVWGASASPNSPLNDDGTLDLDHQAAMRTGAGIPTELPQTITPAGGPAEPAEFSKSGDQPPARPIVIAGESHTPAGNGSRPSSAELSAQARSANSTQELDAIQAQADNRMTTVHDALAQRRAELASGTPPARTEEG